MADKVSSFLHLVDRWRKVRGWRLWFAIAALGVLLMAATQVTYSTGGTRNAYLHVMYIPIALAAYLFRAPGGMLAGAAGGLLLGPFMPISVEEGRNQLTGAWLFRTGFFILIGAFIGQLSHILNLRLDQLHVSIEGLSSTYAHTLKAFASLVAYRDEQTAGHCDRVAHNARAMGEELELTESDLNALYWAGILHDLGKVATPTNLLLKKGPLDADEFEEVKKHASVGGELLVDVSQDLAPIAAGVRAHHERWDGQGYPDGLAGERIPLFGRILAIVDVFEALTSSRPYRGPVDPQEALAYLAAHAGSHFDPTLVPVFERLFERGHVFVSGDEGKLTGTDWPSPFEPMIYRLPYPGGSRRADTN